MGLIWRLTRTVNCCVAHSIFLQCWYPLTQGSSWVGHQGRGLTHLTHPSPHDTSTTHSWSAWTSREHMWCQISPAIFHSVHKCAFRHHTHTVPFLCKHFSSPSLLVMTNSFTVMHTETMWANGCKDHGWRLLSSEQCSHNKKTVISYLVKGLITTIHGIVHPSVVVPFGKNWAFFRQ